jgi:hypothetical protein
VHRGLCRRRSEARSCDSREVQVLRNAPFDFAQGRQDDREAIAG